MNRERLIALVAPALLLVALWAVAVVTTGSSADADQRIESANEELALLDAELAEIRRLEDPAAGAQVTLRMAQAEAAVPPTVDLESVLDEISRLGGVHEVAVEQLVPTIADQADGGVATAPSDTSVVSISFSGRGSYAAIMAFFEELLVDDRLVVVSSLQLASVDELDALLFDATVEVFTTATLSSETEFDDVEEFEEFDDAEAEIE
ncbi:MAG: hypothetical protein ACE367_27340 [Acidimicrobiales bacterium]